MSNFGIVVGGPGTGKTLYLNHLVETHRHPRRTFIVHAPHGGVRGQPVGNVKNLYGKPIPPVALVDGTRDEVLTYALKLGSCTVVKDEAHEWFRNDRQPIPSGSPAYRVLHEGRHHRVFLLTCTQFPYDLHPEVRDMDSWCFFFRLTSQRNLRWALEKTGRREYVEMVRGHSGYRPLLWVPGRGLFQT